MKKIFSLLFLGVFTLFLTGCFNFNSLDNATIYTTVYPITYLADTLYNENSKISSIYPNGVNITDYSLTDKQITDYSKGTLFVYNGTTNEKQIAKTLINKNKQLKIIDVARGLKYVNGVEELWLNPSNYLMLATNFKDNLESLIGSKYISEDIDKKYHALEEKLSIMDATIRKIANEAKENGRETIVVQSKILKFLEDYGFNVICLEDYEENSANLTTLKNNFKAGTYKYLFINDNIPSNEIINDLKDKASAVLIRVNTMTTLTDSEVNNNDNYFTIMNDFINNLKTATSN